MAQWTHVAAVIRFDSFRALAKDPSEVKPPDLDGELPSGSEGKLKTLLWDNPDFSSSPAYTATIFGDLRHYDSAEGVLEYLNGVTARWLEAPHNCGIRAGVAYIDVENRPPIVAWFTGEGWRWEAKPE